METKEKCEIQNANCSKTECRQTSSYFGITALPQNVVTTMAYIPFQTDTSMYTPECALKYGTAFTDLNKAFLGGKCK